MNELGARLKAAREAAGVSLAGLATRTHFSKALVGHLETGARTVRADHVTAYARALNVPVESLYSTPDDPLRVAHQWLVADTPAEAQSRVGRCIGESLTSALEARVIELRHLDDVVGGGDLYPAVRRELANARAVVDESSYDGRIGRRLLTVVGELSQLAGWVASDAGRYAEAQQTYLSGVSAAIEAGDRALAGQLLSSLSYQIANIGNPADAALLARSAVKGAEYATPVVRALLHERLAWASARARDADGTRRALDHVDVAYDTRGASEHEPEWVYWLDRKEIDVMAGRCLIVLGEPARAEPLLTAAVADYTPAHAREVALYRTWIAEAFATSGELDAGRHALNLAHKSGDGVSSARLTARLAEVGRLLGDGAGPQP